MDPFTMMMAMTAVSSLIGAGGNILASQTQAGAQNNAIQTIAQMFGVSVNDIQQMFAQGQQGLSPFITAGSGVLDTLKGLLTPGPSQSAMLEQLPGYQFMRDQGMLAIQNAGTLTGLGGNVLRAGANYVTGLAQSAWSSLVNPLQSLVNTGETAAGQQASLAGTTEQALANAAAGAGSNIASAQIGRGSALAGGITGAAGAIGTGATNLGTIGLLQKLSQPNQQFTGIPGTAGAPTIPGTGEPWIPAPYGEPAPDSTAGAWSSSVIPTAAKGGHLFAGRPTLVGEKGPEMFVPDRPGTVIPHSMLMKKAGGIYGKRLAAA